MCNEASKAFRRRRGEDIWPSWQEWLSGDGIDVGCGYDPITSQMYPKIKDVIKYDQAFQIFKDAQRLPEIGSDSLDFVHSSHCLEHLEDPFMAIASWLRVLKVGGFIVCTVPDNEMYEHGFWPSRFNGDHKKAFTLSEASHDHVVNISQLIYTFGNSVATHRVLFASAGFDNTLSKDIDQTALSTLAECAIEFVLQKVV